MRNRDQVVWASILTVGAFLFVHEGQAAETAAAAAPSNTVANVSSTNGVAADQSYLDDLLSRDKLSGDWNGLRSDLSKHGIDVDFRLSQYYQNVASGGVNQKDSNGGTMDYRINIDSKKFFGGAEGLSFNMHARTRWGEDSNSDAGALALPNGGMMMPAPGDYHDTDITGLTATYMFPAYAGRTALINAGMLDVIDLVTGFFPNVGYGQEGFWNVNSLASNMPWFGTVQGLSLIGLIGETIHPKYQVPESGVIVAGTAGVSTRFDDKMVDDSFEDGTMFSVFQRLFWDLDDKMGYFMVYLSGSTKDQASNDPKDFIEVPGEGLVNTETHKPWDVALYIYQDIWADAHNPDRKANFMIGGTVGPDNPQFAQYNFMANIEVFGLMHSRPDDRMGACYWWNGLSDDFKKLVSDRSRGREKLRNPWGFEFYYNYELTPSMHLTADLQLVENQNKGDDFAIIPGARLVVDF
jgi:porin